MKTIGVMDKIGHRFVDIKPIKKSLSEGKKIVSKGKGKTVVNGAVGFALLVGVVAVVTPFVKAQLQRGEVNHIEMVNLQEDTVNFVKLNTMAVNYANATLADIYTFVQSGSSEDQRHVLIDKKEGLTEYKNKLSPSNPLFLDLSTNTNDKITILLSAIDDVLDYSTTPEEDMVKLNAYTQEYRQYSEKEQTLLVSLLDNAGMQYQVLPNGQIKYSYLERDK